MILVYLSFLHNKAPMNDNEGFKDYKCAHTFIHRHRTYLLLLCLPMPRRLKTHLVQMVVSRFYNIYGDKFVLTFWRNMLLPLSVWLKSAQVDAAMNGRRSVNHTRW